MDSKTAIVTGASSGIGLGIAKALLKDGYHVIAAARNISKAGVLESSERCVLVDGNVANQALGKQLTEIAVTRTGRIDLLVNNAGIFLPGNFHEYMEEQYRSIMSTNADGFFYVTQPVVRQMLRQGHGHVVSISTTLAVQPVKGVNAFGTYFSKGAINAATKSLAIEYSDSNIRFNAIGAGIIDTPMQQFIRGQSRDLLPSVAMFKDFHQSGQLVAPDLVAAKIADRLVLGDVEQGRTYLYKEL